MITKIFNHGTREPLRKTFTMVSSLHNCCVIMYNFEVMKQPERIISHQERQSVLLLTLQDETGFCITGTLFQFLRNQPLILEAPSTKESSRIVSPYKQYCKPLMAKMNIPLLWLYLRLLSAGIYEEGFDFFFLFK